MPPRVTNSGALQGGESEQTDAVPADAPPRPNEEGSKMRKGFVSVVVLTTALLLGPAGSGFAGGSGTRSQGGHGVVQPPGSWHTGFRGNAGGALHPARHGGFRGHPGVGTRVFIGSGFWWGDPWWWGPAYPYYAAPPMLVQEAPPVYIQQEPPAQQPYYWYYCPNPAGYYPYVKECPPGWMTVVPPVNPPAP